MTTKIPVELSSTPGIADSSNATAITIDSSENVTLAGDLTLSSATANKPVLTLTDTNADSQGPDLVFKKDSSSPADNDELFRIYGYGDDDAGNATEGFLMLATMTDVSNGSEDTKVRMMTYGAGSQHDSLTLAGSTAYVNNSSPFAAGAAVLHLHQPDATSNAYLHITQQDGGSTSSDGMSIGVLDGGANAVIRLRENGFLATYTNNTERTRILSDGTFCVGTTHSAVDNTNGLFIQQNGNMYSNIAANQSSYHLRHNYNWQFFVTYQGTVNAVSTSINAISDERLKENIVDINTGLAEVMALKPRKFDWKEGEGSNEKNVAGFIAQEVETVLPDLIGNYKHDRLTDAKSVKMGDMLPTLVKAIQEQQEQIEQLKTEIQTLKGE